MYTHPLQNNRATLNRMLLLKDCRRGLYSPICQCAEMYEISRWSQKRRMLTKTRSIILCL